MIGAANSPMSMFTGGGGDAFQQGMMIGNTNSPASTVADALKNVVDRYHQNLAAQQEHQNKLEEINAQGNAGFGKDAALINYRNTAEMNKMKSINDANSSQPNSGIRTVDVGGRKVYLQDYLDENGRRVSKEIQPAPLLTLQNLVAQNMQGNMNVIPDQGGQNMIQQGASGATTGDQTGATIRVKKNSTGETGTINAGEYDPSQYTRI